MPLGSERPRAAPSPSPEDVRVQLEGAVEQVEAARERHGALESLLSGRRWKRRLRERPEVLRAVVHHASALDEALARIHRRARAEQWPEDLSVLVAVRELEALRSRLETRVRERLGVATADEAPALQGALLQLEALTLQPEPFTLAPGEVLLRQGRTTERAISRRIRVLELFSWLVFWLVVQWHRERILVLMAVFVAYHLYAKARRGTYWLTSERLVWMPWGGNPIQLPLRSLQEDGLRLLSAGFFSGKTRGLEVVGERERLTLEVEAPELVHLVSLLELRTGPLRLGTAPRVEAVCYPATLSLSGAQKGIGVLRPGYVAFLPQEKATTVLRSFKGGPLSKPAYALPGEDLAAMFEQLRHLPSDAAFDACVERAVAEAGGTLWRAGEVLRRDARVPVTKRLHFQTMNGPTASLVGKVDPAQQAMAERILAGWPKP